MNQMKTLIQERRNLLHHSQSCKNELKAGNNLKKNSPPQIIAAMGTYSVATEAKINTVETLEEQ